MNKRFVAVLMFAIIVAAGANLTLYRLTSDTQPLLAPAPTVKLVLASRDLELGTILRDGDIVLADWFGEVPTGRLRQLNHYLEQYIPRQRAIERLKALAPTNGHGGKHVEM